MLYPRDVKEFFEILVNKKENNKKEIQEWEQKLWEVYKPRLYDKKELELFAKLENKE